MHVDCIHCGQPVKVADASEGDWIECPFCEGEVQVPRRSGIKTVGKRRPDDVHPVFVPIVMPAQEESELDEERRKDLEDIRRYRTEDRLGNPIGTIGFAISVTTFLFLFSAAVLYKPLVVYLWFVAILSVPATLLGLIFSIVGCLLVGRPKLFSMIGAGVGAFLLLIGLPLSFLLLKGTFG